jgi:hypothetical protein
MVFSPFTSLCSNSDLVGEFFPQHIQITVRSMHILALAYIVFLLLGSRVQGNQLIIRRLDHTSL